MKRLISWAALSVLLMIGGPWLALQLAGWNAMGVCFLLFYAVNPVFCAVCGGFSGRHIKQLWPLPILAAALYLAGVWIFFELGEPAFLWYAGGYLIIGVLAMLVSAWIKKKFGR